MERARIDRRWGRLLAAGLTLAALSAAAAEVDFDASARSDARVRSALPGDLGTGTTFDVELLPRLGVTASAGSAHVAVSYAPSLVFRDLIGEGLVVPLHRGRASLGFAVGQVTVHLVQEVDYGVTDLGPLQAVDPTTGPPPVGNGHVATLVPYERSSSRVGAEAKVRPGVVLVLEGGYLLSGGPEGTAALPLQRGPVGLARLVTEATPSDTLSTELTGLIANFSTGPEQRLALLTETWARKLSALTTLEAIAGGGVAQTSLPRPDDPGHPEVLGAFSPVAAAGLTTKVPWSGSLLEGRARVHLGPYADPFTGLVYERLEAQASAAWVWRHQLTLALLGSAATGVAQVGAPRVTDGLLFGEASAGWVATPWLMVGAVARGAVSGASDVNGASAPTTLWQAGLNVTVLDQERTSW